MMLSEIEEAELNSFLTCVQGGKIANIEALDGFFAAIACCPDMILPSEYMLVIQSGETEDGDLVFEDMADAERFMELVNRHYNHVNGLLNDGVYLPLLGEDKDGDWRANDWAKGFLTGTHLRHEIWSELINDGDDSGPMIPIMALAYENDPDPKMRPFKEPMDANERQGVLIAAVAGVIHMYQHFLSKRGQYLREGGTFTRKSGKTGRNEPCPCGSGRKFKQCCGRSKTLH